MTSRVTRSGNITEAAPHKWKTLIVDLKTEEGLSVCIVSERWIQARKNTLLYPTHHTAVKTEKAVRNHEEPTRSYEEFPYVTRKICDSWAVARALLRRAVEQSDINTEADDVSKSTKRKRTPKVPYSPTHSSADAEDSDDVTSSAKTGAKKKKNGSQLKKLKLATEVPKEPTEECGELSPLRDFDDDESNTDEEATDPLMLNKDLHTVHEVESEANGTQSDTHEEENLYNGSFTENIYHEIELSKTTATNVDASIEDNLPTSKNTSSQKSLRPVLKPVHPTLREQKAISKTSEEAFQKERDSEITPPTEAASSGKKLVDETSKQKVSNYKTSTQTLQKGIEVQNRPLNSKSASSCKKAADEALKQKLLNSKTTGALQKVGVPNIKQSVLKAAPSCKKATDETSKQKLPNSKTTNSLQKGGGQDIRPSVSNFASSCKKAAEALKQQKMLNLKTTARVDAQKESEPHTGSNVTPKFRNTGEASKRDNIDLLNRKSQQSVTKESERFITPLPDKGKIPKPVQTLGVRSTALVLKENITKQGGRRNVEERLPETRGALPIANKGAKGGSLSKVDKYLIHQLSGVSKKTDKMFSTVDAKLDLILERLVHGARLISLDEVDVKIPVNSYSEWMDLETALSNEETTVALKIKISNEGGSCLAERVQRIWKALITNKFGTQVSWVGQKGKLPVLKSEMYKLAVAAVCSNPTFSGADKKEIENYSKNWIWQSKRRHLRDLEKQGDLNNNELDGANQDEEYKADGNEAQKNDIDEKMNEDEYDPENEVDDHGVAVDDREDDEREYEERRRIYDRFAQDNNSSNSQESSQDSLD